MLLLLFKIKVNLSPVRRGGTGHAGHRRQLVFILYCLTACNVIYFPYALHARVPRNFSELHYRARFESASLFYVHFMQRDVGIKMHFYWKRTKERKNERKKIACIIVNFFHVVGYFHRRSGTSECGAADCTHGPFVNAERTVTGRRGFSDSRGLNRSVGCHVVLFNTINSLILLISFELHLYFFYYALRFCKIHNFHAIFYRWKFFKVFNFLEWLPLHIFNIYI